MRGLVSIVQRFVAEESAAPCAQLENQEVATGVNSVVEEASRELVLDDVLHEAEAAAQEILKYSTGTGTIRRFSIAREHLALAILQADLEELGKIGSSTAFELMSAAVNKDVPSRIPLDEKVDWDFDGLVCFKWLLICMLQRQPYEVNQESLLDVRLQSELLKMPLLFRAYVRYLFSAFGNYVYIGESTKHALFYTEAIKSFLALAGRCEPDDFAVFSQCFRETYPGYLPVCSFDSLKELTTSLRQLTMLLLPEHSEEMDLHPLKPIAEKGQKIRIGLLRYSLDPDVHALLVPISRLDRSKFEIVVFAFDKQGMDQCRSRYADLEYKILNMMDIGGSVNTMRAAQLDIVINGYPLHWWSFEPPARALLKRAANIQCLWAADMITSGMRSFDYWLVGDLYKHLNLEEQFIEKPHYLKGVGFFTNRIGWETKPNEKVRTDLRLRENEIIYLSTADVIKISPEVLRTWLRILKSVDSARLVLVPFSVPDLMGKFRRRFLKSLDQLCEEVGVSRSRVIVYDMCGIVAVYKLIDAADVFLDSIPWSGRSTTTEALLGGKPVVALDGQMLRGNYGAGILRSLGLDDLIASDNDDYIAKAVRLGNDQQFRAEVTQCVVDTAQNSSLVDPSAVAASLEEALLELVDQYREASR